MTAAVGRALVGRCRRSSRSRPAAGLVVAGMALLGAVGSVAQAASITLEGHAVPYRFTQWLQIEDEVEWCHPLAAGQVLHYRFQAGQRMSWSMHYHALHDAATVLREDEVRTVEADYRAPLTADYCIRWQNYGLGPFRLDAEFSVR